MFCSNVEGFHHQHCFQIGPAILKYFFILWEPNNQNVTVGERWWSSGGAIDDFVLGILGFTNFDWGEELLVF